MAFRDGDNFCKAFAGALVQKLCKNCSHPEKLQFFLRIYYTENILMKVGGSKKPQMTYVILKLKTSKASQLNSNTEKALFHPKNASEVTRGPVL